MLRRAGARRVAVSCGLNCIQVRIASTGVNAIGGETQGVPSAQRVEWQKKRLVGWVHGAEE